MPLPGHAEPAPRAAVVGATGFVGRAVVDALTRRGAAITRIPAPRLGSVAPHALEAALAAGEDVVATLAAELRDHDVVINAAGRAEAGSSDLAGLLAANALLPGVLARAADRAGVRRLVHISSGAVQGNADELDSSPQVRPFSAYSYSKAVGEKLALRNHPGTLVYRPAGVQGVERAASGKLVQVASSWLAMTPGDGDGNSPQALVANVADAAAFLAVTAISPPPIVHHPSEGIGVGGLLGLLSGDSPRRIPVWLARGVVRAMITSGYIAPTLAARRRRLEVMWFGQNQAPSWLSQAGWRPVVGHEGWRELGAALRGNHG